jgi:hypothetical protein
METIGSPWMWIGFLAFVLAMLALDLGVFHRQAHKVSVKEAAIWSAGSAPRKGWSSSPATSSRKPSVWTTSSYSC